MLSKPKKGNKILIFLGVNAQLCSGFPDGGSNVSFCLRALTLGLGGWMDEARTFGGTGLYHMFLLWKTPSVLGNTTISLPDNVLFILMDQSCISKRRVC